MRTLSLLFALCCFVFGGGLLTTPAQAQDDLRKLQSTQVNATDGAFEDKVKITWPALGADSAAYRVEVYRDTLADGSVGASDVRIGTASSDDSTFIDTEGDPGVTYEYCLLAEGNATQDGPYCDTGIRTIDAPVGVQATDRSQTGRVTVSWADRSSVDDGYRIRRDGVPVLQTDPGEQSYIDTVQTRGNVAVEYYQGDGLTTLPAFDTSATASGVTDGVELVSTPQPTDYALRLRTRLRVPEAGSYDFTLSTDEVSRLRVAEEVVVDTTGSDGSISLEAGTHLLTVEYLQTDGDEALSLQWAGPSFDAQPLDRERLSLPTDDLPGAKAAYYSYYEGDFGETFPNFDEIDPVRTGASGRFGAQPARGTVDAALRYRATLRTPNDTTYTFYAASDGNSRILINGQVVAVAQAGMGSGTVDLSAGAHSIVVEYLPEAEDASFTVEWGGPFERTEIPFTALSLNRVEHEYCVTTVDAEGFTSGTRCATGAADVAQPPSDVQASDGQYDDRVFLTWTDGVRDDGFRVYRRVIGEEDSTLLATTEPNTITFEDNSAAVGTRYRYCVRAQTENGLVSRANCDTGIRARLPRPGFLSATRGAHDDRIELTWADQSAAEDAYHVYRRPQDAASETFQLADAAPGAGFEYVDGTFEELPDFDALAPDSAGVADSISVAPAPRGTDYALRYRAALRVPEDGEYTFYTASTGASRLRVNGETIVQNGDVQVAQEDSGRVQLETGVHALTVEYVQNDGEAALTAGWRGPSFDRTALQGDRVLPDLGERIARLPANRTELTDEEIEPGRRYVYHVVGVAGDGGISKAAAALGRRARIIAPESVTATDSTYEDRVQIDWESKATRAAIYQVYRDGERIKTVSTPQQTYTDDVPVADTRHRYCVEAVTDAGTVSGQTCDYGSRHLKAPSDLSASDGTEEDVVRLTWSDNSQVEDTTFIRRDGAPLDTLVTPLTEYTDPTAVPKTRHTYGVYVVGGGPGTSDTVRATGYRIFNAPTDVSAGDGAFEQKIRIRWSDESQAEEGYDVYRQVPGSGDSTRVAQLDKNATSYVDEDGSLTVGQTYRYTVKPRDPFGATSPASDTGSTALQPARSVRATAEYSDKVVVSWEDASGLETGYRVLRNGTPVDTLDPNTTQYVDGGAFPQTDYEYCVQTKNQSVVTDARCATGRSVRNGRKVDFVGGGDVYAADLTGNGRKDVLAATSFSQSLKWNENQGGGDFSGTQYIAQEKGFSDVHAADLDGDGDTDVIASASGVYWYENDGNANFTAHTVNADVLAESVQTGDLDGDGDMDILSSESFTTRDATERNLIWYENDGSGSFTSHTVTESSGGELSTSDLDGDGDTDVLTASGEGIVWYENDGEGNFTTRSLTSDFARSVSPADVDGDGDMDIFAHSSTELRWYENDGDENFSSRTFLSGQTRLSAVAAADMDQDGDQDVLSTANPDDSPIGWFENDGDGNFSAQRVMTETWEGQDVYAADLGGSARPEVLSASRRGQKIFVSFKTDVPTRASLAAPSSVEATDGSNEDKVRISWTDNADSEEGYRIYRNGEEIGTVDADGTRYDDTNARAGSASRFCVAAFNENGESGRRCDYGRRPPNGAFTGRVTTSAGAGVSSVDVCLTPTPGQGLQLDGDGGEAQTTADVPLNAGDFTISFWAKRSATGKNSYVISQGESETNRGLHIGFRDTDVFTMAFWDNDLNTSDSYTSREWHHWAVTYDRSSGERTIYRDTAVVATDQADAPYEGSGPLNIGRRTDGAGHFQGHLDEIRVWNRVRSPDSIGADMREELAGTEDGLTAYWPVEQGAADALADPTDEDGTRYATFRGGAHRSGVVAPLDICARTDKEGNYELGGIRYGQETTFEVAPDQGNRTFDPAFKEITLNPENPVQNEVGFRDISSFTIAGSAKIEGRQCFIESLPIGIDGSPKGKTDSDGVFSVAAQAGTHTLSPQPTGNRTFKNPERTFFVRDDTSGIAFVDESRRTVTGTMGGGQCGIPIGTVSLRFEPENGCHDPIVKEVQSGGTYEVSGLPPLVYNVRVANVNLPDESDLAKSDIISYFKNNFGTKKLDLTGGDDTLDVIYRAPLTASIEGLPKPNSQCSAGLQVEDKSLPNVPVLDQSEEGIPYQVNVVEDYGQAGLCPVDSGTVRVYDEWAGTADEAKELTITDGTATDTTKAMVPTFTSRVVDGTDRTYQRKISAVAEVGGRTATANKWGLIAGKRTRQGTDFVTGSTGPVPIKILRDPPGDASSAFVEEGSSFCRALSSSISVGRNVEGTVSIIAGADFGVGLSGNWIQTEISVTQGISFRMAWEQTTEATSQICMTSQESFSTSDDELFVGRQGDVFIGTAANLLFTELDVLKKKTGQSCTLDRFTKVGYEPNGFETAYAFSTYHLENSLIPRLSDLMDDARRRIANGDTEAEDRLQQLRRDSIEWRNHLEYNDELKSQAETKVNRSFDAGSEYTFSQTTEESSSWAWETSTEAEIGRFLDVDATVGGAGFGLSLSSSTTVASTVRQEGSQTDTRTVGYTLSDDDIGDYFSVDVKSDPVYNTPVFELRAGQSSCPWEGPTQRLDGSEVDGTVPRYKSVIQSNGSPEKTGVPPDEQATFNVTLTNDSQSGDAWRYAIRPIQSSNPNGAKLRINGGAFNGPQAYFLQPGEDGSTKITLGVERGPYAYRYEDLQVKMAPPCEQAIFEDGGGIRQADTLSLSVQFDAPCTDVNLFRPQENWTISGTDTSLETIFRNFSLTRPEQLGEVGLQYRRSDQEGWTDAVRVPADTVEQTGTELAQSEGRYEYVSDWAAVTNLPDGEYQLRAYSQCPSAEKRVYSAPAKGVKDIERPQVLDTPEPADGVFAFGDDISVTFTEPIDCESVVTQGTNPTALLYTPGGDTLSTTVRCNNRRLVFRAGPTEDLAAYEDSTLTAELKGSYTTADGRVEEGITDPVGNRLKTADPLSDDRTWSFEVRRRSFAWQNASTQTQVDFEQSGAFADTLSNGSPQDVVFDLESRRYGQTWSEHPWLAPETTQGTVPGGETQAVNFTVADTLEKGTYRDTVLANSAVGARDLGVTARVTCRAPFGTPPDGAAYTMSLTARLDIPSELGGNGVSTDSLDRVAAFVGNELRGVAPLEAATIGGQTTYRAFLTVRSDRKLGETVTFRLWDGSECRSFYAEETVPFRANDAVGSPGSPTTLTATQAAAQSVPLAAGWSWVSVNTMTEDSNAVNTALSTVVPSDGDVVKGQGDFSQYSADRGQWIGSLESLRPGRGYLVRLQEQSSLVLLGDSVAVDRQLDLMEGWNWLGYLPQRPLPVDHALQNLDPAPSEGDVIKGQTAFAQYVNEEVGWLGSLETLRPGRAYLLNVNEASTLAYPTDAPTQTQVTVESVASTDATRTNVSGTNVTAADAERGGNRSASGTAGGQGEGRSSLKAMSSQGQSALGPSASEQSTPEPPTETAEAMPSWSVDARAHGQSMTVVATVQVNGEPLADPQARLGAFIGGELRGAARPVKLPKQEGAGGDAYRAFLVVHGAAQEEGDVSFRLFNPKTRQVRRETRLLGGLPGVNRSTARGKLPTTVDFVPGTSRGTVGDPVWINAGELPDDFTPARVQLKGNYPNPATRQTTVRFALPKQERVTIEMYDVLGRRIRRVVNSAKKPGWHEVTLDTHRLASGVYFYRMEAGAFRESRKMVVVK